MSAGRSAPGFHRPRLALALRSLRRFPSSPVACMLHTRAAPRCAFRDTSSFGEGARLGRAGITVKQRKCKRCKVSSPDPRRRVIRPGRCADVLPFAPMTQAKLTAKELDDLRARLLEERTHLEAQLVSIVEGSFAATQSDLSGDVGLDDESADAGTATFEREKDLSIENNVRDLLRKIEGALKRMDAGTYGLCERCGKPIEKARIKALPYAELCIKDAQAAQSRR